MPHERIYVDEPLPLFDARPSLRRDDLRPSKTAADVRESSESSESSVPGERTVRRARFGDRATPLPERYVEMRRLAFSRELSGRSRAEVFCRQAEFMADFEEHDDIRADFFCYYPTFAEMSARELRAYYAWRTAWREGRRRETSLSFAYVYIYELINAIGFDSPEAAFYALVDFTQSYERFARSIDTYAHTWLNDFVIYHGLDPKLLRSHTQNETTEAAKILLEFERHEPATVFAAFRRLSAWPFGGPFFEANAKKIEALVLDTLKKLAALTAKDGRNALEAAIGPRLRLSYRPFAAAVFWDRRIREDRVYEADPIVRYRCANGVWMREELAPGRGRNDMLGVLGKLVEARLRRTLRYRHRLSEPNAGEMLLGIVNDVFLEEAARERALANPVRTLDFSRLGTIRTAALATQEKLIVEAPPAEEPLPLSAPAEARVPLESTSASAAHESEAASAAIPRTSRAPSVEPPGSLTSTQGWGFEEKQALTTAPTPELHGAQENKTALTAQEAALLRTLLAGSDPTAAIADIGRSVPRIIDDINEKLFDFVGDAVLENANGALSLMPDYAHEIEDYLNGSNA